MTDLRTRIAKVLYRRFGPSLGAHPDGWDHEPVGTQEMYLEDADAVIRELGADCFFWFDKSERMQRFALLHGKAHRD